MRAALKAGRSVGLAICAVCLALWVGNSAAQTLTLTRDQAIAMARQAYLAGDPALTYAIASKIVADDRGDVEALLLLSASTEALGHPGEAFALGKRAWAAAQTAKGVAGLRFDIAQQTAHAALSAGHFRGAARWLGRAVDLAPTPEVRSQREADRHRIESLVRLSFSADMQVSPTDNLNNGATTGLLIVQDQVVGSISGWSVAHAGIVTYGKIGADYALGVTGSGKARNNLGFALSATLHALSASEAAANRTLQGQDLDLWTASLHWTQERFLGGAAFAGRLPLRLTLEASQNWYAGQPYSPTLRAEVEVPLTKAQGPDDLALVATLERQWQDAPSGVVTGASLHLQGHRDLTLPWAPGQLGYGFGATVLRSDWSNTTSDSLDANLTLDPGLHAGPVHGRFGMGVSWRKYDTYSLGFANVTKGRTDHGLWLRAGLGLEEMKLAGMTPSLSVMRQLTWSNISKYQTASTTLYLGLAAEF